LAHGVPLTPRQQKDAADEGVKSSEKVRLQVVRDIPGPAHPVLNKVARDTGLSGPGTAGLTLRYAIYIRHEAQLDRKRFSAVLCPHLASRAMSGTVWPTFGMWSRVYGRPYG
jgi:hypothetical protein